MSASLRDELSELVRHVATHIAWQRELGTLELPRHGSLPFEPPSVDPSPHAVAPSQGGEGTVAVPSSPTSAVLASPPPRAAAPSRGDAGPPAAPSSPTSLVHASPFPRAAAPVVPVVPVQRSLFEEPPVQPAPPQRLSAGPPLEGEARLKALAVVHDQVKACTACRLAATRHNTVFARGDPFARLCFIGEGPGEQEDKQGLPFVGPAGQLLDRIIAAMGLRPDQVYIANIVKCRPPNNRVPEGDEMRACTPFLVRQLDLVRPEVIVALGRTAVGFLLDTKEPMSRLRGRWHSYEGIPVLPTWHPAYLLRTPEAKADTWADMKVVMARLGLTLPPRGASQG